MDDPLSAVDSHVGEHIFNEVMIKLLAGTTRVLVTNQLQYLREVDHIVFLEQGHFSPVVASCSHRSQCVQEK